MNDARKDMVGVPDCEDVREQLPLRVAGVYRDGDATGAAAGLEAHLADCPDCADELAFLQMLGDARPSPPANLAVRVVTRALGSRPHETWNTSGEDGSVLPFRAPRRTPGWGHWWANPAAAAAVLVLAVGMGLVARGGAPGTDAGAVLAAFDAQAAEMWAEDWLVAGAPYLDGVSDETLALLAAGIDP
jgi:anti-sigma factor RsiW